jgi:hypothetical protein
LPATRASLAEYVALEEASGTRHELVELVEVLSPSTEAYDRGAKWLHYQRLASLRECLLVSPGEPRVERFLLGDDGTWRYEVVDAPRRAGDVAIVRHRSGFRGNLRRRPGGVEIRSNMEASSRVAGRRSIALAT